MGLDFIRMTMPSFNRVLDKRLIDLNSPKLFGQDLPIISRTVRAEICAGVTVAEGDKLLVRLIENKVVLQRGNAMVAECASAPAEFIAHLRAGAGIADCEIKSLQPISQTMEIGICG